MFSFIILLALICSLNIHTHIICIVHRGYKSYVSSKMISCLQFIHGFEQSIRDCSALPPNLSIRISTIMIHYATILHGLFVTTLIFNSNTFEVPLNHLFTKQARTSPSCLSFTKHELSKACN